MMPWNFYMNDWEHFGLFAGLGLLISIPLLLWSLYWKGMALWKAAREGHRNWFIALLLINTAGILDILYIYVFSKKNPPPSENQGNK